MRLLILAVVLLTGCGTASKQQSPSLGQFSTLVNQFVSDAAAHGKTVDASHLVIQVHTFPSTTTVVNQTATETDTETESVNGQCNYDSINGPTVWISDVVASTYGPESLEAVVYHELGHCLLQRDHTNGLDSSGNPISIMYYSTLPGGTYYAAREAYLVELFSVEDTDGNTQDSSTSN